MITVKLEAENLAQAEVRSASEHGVYITLDRREKWNKAGLLR